jgi:hypothetical protein
MLSSLQGKVYLKEAKSQHRDTACAHLDGSF